MDYQIALSPELEWTAEAFVAAWNDTPECRAVAEAHTEQRGPAQFDPLVSGMITMLSTIGVGIATNILYDLIKQALAGRGARKQATVEEFVQQDGTRVLVVRVTEE